MLWQAEWFQDNDDAGFALAPPVSAMCSVLSDPLQVGDTLQFPKAAEH